MDTKHGLWGRKKGNKIKVFEIWELRRMKGIKWINRMSNEEV